MQYQINYQPTARVQIDFSQEPILVKQAMRDECDVNGIMKKFIKTGLIEHVNNHHGDYGNFIGFEDYHSSMNRIRAAEHAFMSIPAGIRAKFDNDPSKFLLFAQDDGNEDEMIAMGLASARPSEAPGEPEKDAAEEPLEGAKGAQGAQGEPPPPLSV